MRRAEEIHDRMPVRCTSRSERTVVRIEPKKDPWVLQRELSLHVLRSCGALTLAQNSTISWIGPYHHGRVNFHRPTFCDRCRPDVYNGHLSNEWPTSLGKEEFKSLLPSERSPELPQWWSKYRAWLSLGGRRIQWIGKPGICRAWPFNEGQAKFEPR